MTGDRQPEQVTRDVRDLLRPGVEVLAGEVRAIDLANRRVELERDSLEYDYLVVALGAELAPDAIPGLAAGAHTFYTLSGERPDCGRPWTTSLAEPWPSSSVRCRTSARARRMKERCSSPTFSGGTALEIG
jgi:NADPH-dependent 2,4-dienoyl-CoA reductase/sulfur reductase-like enzyme